MEFKLGKSISYYENGALQKANTLAFNDVKGDIAKCQRELARYFNKYAMSYIHSINKDNSTTENVNQEIKKDETLEEKLKTYKAVGLALYSYVAEEDIKVIKVMAKYGLIYHKIDEDLKDNDEFLNELDIQDIYIILGYYLINFTMKQLV